MLKKGVVSQVKEKPNVVNPLTVAYSRASKPRLVLDCRHIKPCLHLFKVKFEDIRVAERLFDINSYIFTFDLKSPYHHIDIFPEHTTYVGFSWSYNGTVKYYIYNSLQSLGIYLQKTLRVLEIVRLKSYHVLDDGIGEDVRLDRAIFASNFIRGSLLEGRR